MPTVTTNAALGNPGAALALAYLLRRRGLHYFLGLHTGDPDGPTPHEFAGDGYVRDEITFHDPSSRGIVSSNGQMFTGVPVDTITWLGVWDAISEGALLLKLALNPALGTTDGGKVILAPGDIGFVF